MSTESTDPVEPPATVAPAPEEAETDESPKKNWLKFVIVGVLAVALIGIGTWAVTSLNSAKVGDCVSASPKDVDKPDGEWNISSQGCGDVKATHRVAKILNGAGESCPEEGIYEQMESGKKFMCLMPNLAEGNCYTSSDDGAFKKEACTTESPVKIVKKVDGLPQEGTACPEGSSELRFSEPASVYCMGVHEGS
ncbi:LppU/SCO3897 family protein [Lentzea nigeriaca]|uniref:LppU/SCO3897 family protein n=1 Tax=Lentzea nigeriaca TaxID=1128665 RepID=UPI00195E6BE1|nr:hypothetical protein [Lentzea nigeriaca]MBM7858132.1 hypothetical protein [Lentzea nigeriaca]